MSTLKREKKKEKKRFNLLEETKLSQQRFLTIMYISPVDSSSEDVSNYNDVVSRKREKEKHGRQKNSLL